MGKKKITFKTSYLKNIFIVVFTGIIVLTFVYITFTEYGKKQVSKVVDSMLDFVQKRTTNYDNYIENDEAKSLYRLADKTSELARCLDKEEDRASFIKQYIHNQRFDGVIITNENLELELETETGIYDKWSYVINSNIVKDIIEYPQKNYLTRIKTEDGVYDIVVVSRQYTKGVIMTFDYKNNDYSNNGDITIDMLITDFDFNMDGVAIITDDYKVLNSNLPDIQGISVKEYLALHEGQLEKDEKGMIVAYYNGGYWYGKKKSTDNYTIYAFCPDYAVFELRKNAMIISMFIYAIFISIIIAIKQRILYRNTRQMQQQEIEYRQQILEAARQAKSANIAKTDFLRRMSHDIRTPINGIRGMVEICRYNLGNIKKEEECLDKIMSASGFLLDLVNDVLDMNKLESGDIYLRMEPFSLSKVIGEISNVIEMQAMEQGITYKMSCENIKYDNLIGSELHLKQVLQNILSNAVKYNVENGSVSLSYSEIFRNEMMYIEFVCKDTGIGMSEEFQRIAYEPFAQESENARTDYNGTGLGLAITKKIVDKMGGVINFDSELGKGTTFKIIIPFKINYDAETEENIEKKEENSIKGMKILIAEDNELNMEITKFMLENEGAIASEAHNGQEALDKFVNSKEGEYDVILMDIMMPVMNGLDTTKKIRSLDRADAKKVVIIAMSANAFYDDIERSKDAGMNEHVAKPVDADVLIDVISKYSK